MSLNNQLYPTIPTEILETMPVEPLAVLCFFIISFISKHYVLYLSLTTKVEKSLSGDDTAYGMARTIQSWFTGALLDATAVNSCPPDVSGLPACLGAYLLPCPPAGLSACLHACVSAGLPT